MMNGPLERIGRTVAQALRPDHRQRNRSQRGEAEDGEVKPIKHVFAIAGRAAGSQPRLTRTARAP